MEEQMMRSQKRRKKLLMRKKQEMTERSKKTEHKFSTVLISKDHRNPNFEEENWGEIDHGNANFMDPDLYRAVTGGNILEFVQAIEKGPAERQFDLPSSCIQISPQKNSALHIATTYKHHEIVNLICKDLPFFIPEKNYRGDTALHIAARIGDSLLVNLLVNGINEKDIKAVLSEKNEEGNTALHEALRFRHERVAWILIDRNRDMVYCVNEEGKSVLYLAAEAGFVELVRVIMENPLGISNRDQEKSKNKSPVLAAIHGRRTDVINMMWEKDQFSFHLRCEQGKNPLHYAASIGYFEAVNFLLDKIYDSAYQRDKNGNYPIHTASQKGYIDIIQEFLRQCPDSRELLNRQGQNILHVTAKSGKIHAVNFMLKTPTLGRLLNERDIDGNTPLHLATIFKHPKIVSSLAEDRRVNLKVKNKDGLTAPDIANVNMEVTATFRKRLTWLALRHACAQRSQLKIFKNSKQEEKSKLENQRDMASIILLVSIFIATVTFSAAFTIPGGDNNSNPNQGIAIMVMKKMFHTFVISDTIALYSSIMVAITLIWAQSSDLCLVPCALKLALPLLGVAIVAMSIAFMAGLNLVVSNLAWLRNLVLFTELIFFVILSALFFPLCFSSSISYYPFHLILFAFGNYNDEE